VSQSVKARLNNFRIGKPRAPVYLDAPAPAPIPAAGTAVDGTAVHGTAVAAGTDVHGMPLSEEELIAVGIDPAWLEVDKVVATRVDKRKQRKTQGSDGDDGEAGVEYLVKWRKLDYDACTWERAGFVAAEAPESLKRWRRFRRLDGGVDRDGDGEGSETVDAAAASGSGGDGGDASFQPWDAAPEWLKATGGDLHPYQVEGVNWLRHAHKVGKHVILADEMGLGKTVQTLVELYELNPLDP
jgi:chromodomain-helicase-DNA-binding protein 4